MSRVLQNATNQITQKYNTLSHKGVDLVKEKNKTAEVIAHSDGIVVSMSVGHQNDRKATGTSSYGNYVKLRHNNGMYTLYAHLKSVYVKKNALVKRGEVLGPMGQSGNASGNHLHFEVRNASDKRINPTPYLDSDLPNMNQEVNVIYQSYDNKTGKWLPNVTNDKDYAGNLGNPIGGVYINLTEGSIKYRVHELNNEWLPIVTDRDDYAGNLGKSIDGIQMSSDKHVISYRVHLMDYGWLPWVSKFDNTNEGYAGIYGHEIDAIQIKIIE